MAPLEFACAAERRDREKYEQGGDTNRESNQPRCHVTGPGAGGGIEPGQSEDGEDGASHFVKKLLQDAPEAAKTVLLRGCFG